LPEHHLSVTLGMQAGVLAFVVSKIPPPADDPFAGRVVCIVAFMRDDADYSEAAHQLIHFMDSTRGRNRDQTLKSYLLVGNECLVFKMGSRS